MNPKSTQILFLQSLFITVVQGTPTQSLKVIRLLITNDWQGSQLAAYTTKCGINGIYRSPFSQAIE